MNRHMLLSISDWNKRSDTKWTFQRVHQQHQRSRKTSRPNQELRRIICKGNQYMHILISMYILSDSDLFLCAVFSYAWKEFRSECLKTRR